MRKNLFVIHRSLRWEASFDAIQEALVYMMTSDQRFIETIELSTSSVQAVTTRFDKWRLMLQEIRGIQHKEPRCFSHALKQRCLRKTLHVSVGDESSWSMMLHWITLNNTGVAGKLFLRTLA